MLKKSDFLKTKLIVLSDLLGNYNTDWVSPYIDLLKQKFEVQFYNCYELAEVDSELTGKEEIHNQFIKSGIEKVVEKLLQNEKGEISIIGFSIGGLIAWKAALSGLNASYICAISSTRLRYETQKPNALIDLFFAENDPYKPDKKWFEFMQLDKVIFKNETHEFYMNQEFAYEISHKIFEKMNPVF